MTSGPKPTAEKSTTKDQILVWPSSLLSRPPEQGFAVGWRCEQSRCCCTVTVAGVIPASDSDMNPVYKRISLRIRELTEGTCCCCSCDSTLSEKAEILQERFGSVCDGCVRAMCLKELRLVAFYSPSDPSVSKAGTLNLPVISSLDTWPWWTGDSKGSGNDRQLVIYDDVGRNGSTCLYVGSGFRDEFLVRLTHAACMVRLFAPEGSRHDDEEIPDENGGEITHAHAPRRLPVLAGRSLFLQRMGSGGSLLDLIASVRLAQSTQRDSLRKDPVACTKCHKRQFVPRSLYAKAAHTLKRADRVLHASFDVILGLLLGFCLLLIWKRAGGVEGFRQLIARHFAAVRRGAAWLGDFPAGFKLNERLTELMGEAIATFLAVHERVLLHAVALAESSGVVQPWLLPSIGLLYGASGLLAFLVDLGQLGTVHLHLLSAFYGWIYRIELRLLASLWCLFRGKKKNVLRQRIDTMEYDSTQLLLGTIVFAICLLLLTTVFVYHFFFAAVAFGTDLAVLLPPLLLHQLLERAPCGALWLRATTGSCVGDATLLLVPSVAAGERRLGGVDITRLVAPDRGYVAIARDARSAPLQAAVRHAARALLRLVSGRPHPALVVALLDGPTVAPQTVESH